MALSLVQRVALSLVPLILVAISLVTQVALSLVPLILVAISLATQVTLSLVPLMALSLVRLPMLLVALSLVPLAPNVPMASPASQVASNISLLMPASC